MFNSTYLILRTTASLNALARGVQRNMEDVSNFDTEFTCEKAVLTPPKERRPITADDQTQFKEFDYVPENW